MTPERQRQIEAMLAAIDGNGWSMKYRTLYGERVSKGAIFPCGEAWDQMFERQRVPHCLAEVYTQSGLYNVHANAAFIAAAPDIIRELLDALKAESEE